MATYHSSPDTPETSPHLASILPHHLFLRKPCRKRHAMCTGPRVRIRQGCLSRFEPGRGLCHPLQPQIRTDTSACISTTIYLARGSPGSTNCYTSSDTPRTASFPASSVSTYPLVVSKTNSPTDLGGISGQSSTSSRLEFPGLPVPSTRRNPRAASPPTSMARHQARHCSSFTYDAHWS